MAFCSLYQTSNLGFQPLLSNPGVCMTYACPKSTTTPMDNYFQQTAWGSNINNSCMKPLADAEVSKQYRCDERWYDWFTVPNYHLGNTYTNPDPSNPGTCYNPCGSGTLPAFNTDPVDGQTLHYLTNKDYTNLCVSRSDYFGGKYAKGSDYCPLSWIYMLNSTSKSLESLVKDQNKTFANSDIAKNVLTDAYKDNQKNAREYANTISGLFPIELNNILTPTNDMQTACNKLQSRERLLPAYGLCSNLMVNESSIYDVVAKSLPPNFAKNKVTMMKQACNAVFCNLRDPAPSKINKSPLCFKYVGTFDPSTGETIDQKKLPPPLAPRPTAQKRFMMKSIKTAVYLVITPILAYLIYIFISDVLYPYVILPAYLKLFVLLGYKPYLYDSEYLLFRDSTIQLDKFEKQCRNSKIKFDKQNKALRAQGKPELPTPPSFAKCEKELDIKGKHKVIQDSLKTIVANVGSGAAAGKASAAPAADAGAGGKPGAGEGAPPGGDAMGSIMSSFMPK